MAQGTVQPDAGFGSNGSVSTGLFGRGGFYSNVSPVQQPVRDLNLGQMALANNRIWMCGTGANGFEVQGYLAGNGAPDAGFGTNGVFTTTFPVPVQAAGLAVQPDGKLVVVGQQPDQFSANMAVVRLSQTGVLDAGFGTNGLVLGNFTTPRNMTRVVVQANGNLLMAGPGPDGSHQFSVMRLLPNGQFDNSFRNGSAFASFPDNFQHLLEQPDGKVLLISSEFNTSPTSLAGVRLRRLTVAGALDPGFGPNGSVIVHGTQVSSGSMQRVPAFTEAYGAAVQPDGKILLAGRVYVSRLGAGNQPALLRLNADGTPDAAFNANAEVALTISGGLQTVAVQADGKIVAAGSGNLLQTAGMQALIARFNPDGTLDATFTPPTGNAPAGTYVQTLPSGRGTVGTLAFQPNGQMLTLGGYENLNGQPQGIRLARYTATQPTATLPAATALHLQALPMPASGLMHLRYSLAKPAPVQLLLHDQLGRLVASTQPAEQRAGQHEHTFDTAPLASGVYFCTLEAGAERQRLKVVVSH